VVSISKEHYRGIPIYSPLLGRSRYSESDGEGYTTDLRVLLTIAR